MEILKLKEEFGAVELLKEQIRELDTKFKKLNEELKECIDDNIFEWKDEVFNEANNFFANNNFTISKSKKDDQANYSFGNGTVSLEKEGYSLFPLRFEIKIDSKEMREIFELRPKGEEDNIYDNETPGLRCKIKNLYSSFTMYNLDSIDDRDGLESVKQDYERLIGLIMKTIDLLKEKPKYSYVQTRYNNSTERNEVMTISDTFEDFFKKL